MKWIYLIGFMALGSIAFQNCAKPNSADEKSKPPVLLDPGAPPVVLGEDPRLGISFSKTIVDKSIRKLGINVMFRPKLEHVGKRARIYLLEKRRVPGSSSQTVDLYKVNNQWIESAEAIVFKEINALSNEELVELIKGESMQNRLGSRFYVGYGIVNAADEDDFKVTGRLMEVHRSEVSFFEMGNNDGYTLQLQMTAPLEQEQNEDLAKIFVAILLKTNPDDEGVVYLLAQNRDGTKELKQFAGAESNAHFYKSVNLSAEDLTVDLLDNVDLTPYLGSEIYVGYGFGENPIDDLSRRGTLFQLMKVE